MIEELLIATMLPQDPTLGRFRGASVRGVLFVVGDLGTLQSLFASLATPFVLVHI